MDEDIQLRPSAPTLNPLAGAKVAPPVVTLKQSLSCGSLEQLDKINVLKKNIAKRPSRGSISGSEDDTQKQLTAGPTDSQGRTRSISLSGQSPLGPTAPQPPPPQQQAQLAQLPPQPKFSFKPPQPPPSFSSVRRHTVVGAPGTDRRRHAPRARPFPISGHGTAMETIPSLENVSSQGSTLKDLASGEIASSEEEPSLRGRDTSAAPSAIPRHADLSMAAGRVNSLPMGTSPSSVRRNSSLEKAGGADFFWQRGTAGGGGDERSSTPLNDKDHLMAEDPLSHLRRIAGGSQPTSPQRSPVTLPRRHSMRARSSERPNVAPPTGLGKSGISASDANWRSPAASPSINTRRATVSGSSREASLLRKILTEPKVGAGGEQQESLLDIRGRIHCKLFNFGDGICPYQDNCHYRHALRDGTLVKPDYIEHFTSAAAEGAGVPSLSDMRSQIPCKLFNFGDGYCEYGASCYYKHCTREGQLLEKTGSLTSLNRLRFQNPYGEGDICAAGIIPFSYAAVPEQYVAEGAVWALLQVEDVRIEGTKKWKPGLALFGGKVQEEDADWLETTAREFAEETGGLLGEFKPLRNMIDGVPLKISCFRIEGDSEAGSFTKYLPCKYQVLYYPIEEDDLQAFLALQQKYWDTFQGQVSRDWSRAATRMEPVLLRPVDMVKDSMPARVAVPLENEIALEHPPTHAVLPAQPDAVNGSGEEDDSQPSRTQPRSRTVSESGEERQVPRRGWAVCYLDTGRVHEMDCSVQLRQALEAAEFPVPDNSTADEIYQDLIGSTHNLDSIIGLVVGAGNTPVVPKSASELPTLSTKGTTAASVPIKAPAPAPKTAAPAPAPASAPAQVPQVQPQPAEKARSPLATATPSATQTLPPEPQADMGLQQQQRAAPEAADIVTQAQEWFESHKNHIIVALLALLVLNWLRG